MVAERRHPTWAVLLFASCLCCLPITAQACRCAPLTLAEFAERAEVVMKVEVLAVDVVPADAAGPAHRRATIRVHGNYKNAVGIAAVSTALETAQCGLDLRPGTPYWIFGQLRPAKADAEAEVWTHRCDGSRPVTEDFHDTPWNDVHTRLEGLAAKLDCPSPTSAEIARDVRLVTIDRLPIPDAAVRSPNNAYRYWLSTPPSASRAAHLAALIVDTGGTQHLHLSLHGARTPLTAAWINEKLIHLRVSWSGLLRTNLVLDVEQGRIVVAHQEHRDDRGAQWRPLADTCHVRRYGPTTTEQGEGRDLSIDRALMPRRRP